jgi:hypothetical protein
MKPFRAIAVAVFSAQLALGHIASVGTPAQASLTGGLREGENRYLEVSIEPGTYALFVETEGEASFLLYENNGRLIGKSRRFASDSKDTSQGLMLEVSRLLVAHIWLRMETCKSVCYFQVVPLKRTSKGSRYTRFPSKVLASRPSYRASSSPQPENNTPPRRSGTSPSNQYVLNTNSYVNTNLPVNPGDKIRVKASGTVRFGAFVGSGGPRGIIINPQYNYFTDLPHGQLIGRIKQSGAEDLEGWFPIAEGREFVARSSGVLEFAVNDNRPRDNSGSFRIQVTIEPAK